MNEPSLRVPVTLCHGKWLMTVNINFFRVLTSSRSSCKLSAGVIETILIRKYPGQNVMTKGIRPAFTRWALSIGSNSFLVWTPRTRYTWARNNLQVVGYPRLLPAHMQSPTWFLHLLLINLLPMFNDSWNQSSVNCLEQFTQRLGERCEWYSLHRLLPPELDFFQNFKFPFHFHF